MRVMTLHLTQFGECTWGVKSQLSWVGPYWGDAKQWLASARAEGF